MKQILHGHGGRAHEAANSPEILEGKLLRDLREIFVVDGHQVNDELRWVYTLLQVWYRAQGVLASRCSSKLHFSAGFGEGGEGGRGGSTIGGDGWLSP